MRKETNKHNSITWYMTYRGLLKKLSKETDKLTSSETKDQKSLCYDFKHCAERRLSTVLGTSADILLVMQLLLCFVYGSERFVWLLDDFIHQLAAHTLLRVRGAAVHMRTH
eukprot:865734-Amphidinium_carterae.1